MIFVTGGSGLVGAHLIEALHREGKSVKALYRSHIPTQLKDKATWLQGDILDVIALEEALKDVSEVYHVAGLVSFDSSQKRQLHKVNVEGTANVVNACLDAGVRKLVHVSSVAALGRLRENECIHEGLNWSEATSNSEYGKSKYLAELEVWRGVGEGLQAVVVNPTIIIGEHGDWTKGSMQIFHSLYHGFPFYSMGKTGFVDADDLAKAMIELMQSDISAERFIVSAENIYYRDFFNMVTDAFGLKRPTIQITPFKAAIAWRFFAVKRWLTGKSPLVTKETAATSLAVVQFDNGKLLKALPYFRYRPIQESVKRICSHLLAHAAG